MASRCFVVNEWLFHDLLGENGEHKQEQTYQFLERLRERCDRIAY